MGTCRVCRACSPVFHHARKCHVDVKFVAHIGTEHPGICCSMQIWSTSQPNPVSGIDVKANVCCAKYNPGSSYEIAVGAADHTVLTYDLRKSDRPVHTFRGGLAHTLTASMGAMLASSILHLLLQGIILWLTVQTEQTVHLLLWLSFMHLDGY